VMYEPMPMGKMELVAVEYITQGTGLAGRPIVQFHRRAQSLRPWGPGFYELHVWAWKANRAVRSRTFERMTCGHAHGK